MVREYENNMLSECNELKILYYRCKKTANIHDQQNVLHTSNKLRVERDK